VMPHGEARPDTFFCALLDLGSGVLGMAAAFGPIPKGSSIPG